MKLLNSSLTDELQDVFKTMKDTVDVILFTTLIDCETCEQTTSFMQEIQELGDKINFIHHDIDDQPDEVKKYTIEHTPAIVLLNPKVGYQGVKFYGIPAGHEINSFISGILEVSGVGEILPKSMIERIDSITQPVNIKVFVTLGCPHCPGAVQKAHKLALTNQWISSEMIESQTFKDLAKSFNVMSVPRIIINDKEDVIGNQPLDTIIEAIEKALATD